MKRFIDLARSRMATDYGHYVMRRYYRDAGLGCAMMVVVLPAVHYIYEPFDFWLKLLQAAATCVAVFCVLWCYTIFYLCICDEDTKDYQKYLKKKSQ